MTLIIASQSNRKQAEAYSGMIVSPTHTRAIHGMDRVVIIGSHPHLEKRYRGICPIQVIPTHDGQPDISDD